MNVLRIIFPGRIKHDGADTKRGNFITGITQMGIREVIIIITTTTNLLG